MAQEALANIAKHARARHAWLPAHAARRHGGTGRSDDGIGLAAAPRTEGAHYGVAGMRERMEALGGTLTLAPRPEGGTISAGWHPDAGGGRCRDIRILLAEDQTLLRHGLRTILDLEPGLTVVGEAAAVRKRWNAPWPSSQISS